MLIHGRHLWRFTVTCSYAHSDLVLRAPDLVVPGMDSQKQFSLPGHDLYEVRSGCNASRLPGLNSH